MLSSSVEITGAVRSAQVASVFISATAAGGMLGLSAFAIPRILEAPPSLMLVQWKRMAHACQTMFPAAAAAAAVSYAYVCHATNHVNRMPLVAAGLCVSILPYSLLFLLPTTKQLLARAADAEAGATFTAKDEASAKQLIDSWGTWSLGRPLLLAAASLVGLVTYL